MRTADLISFGLFSLRRQKLRTALTLLGVIIGTSVLVISISVRLGVHETIVEQFRKHENLRQIIVLPSSDGYEDSLEGVPDEIREVPGEMSDAKRARIQRFQVARWKRRNTQPAPKPLTRARVEELSRLPHVESASPEMSAWGRAFLNLNKQSSEAHLYGLPIESKPLAPRVEVGGRFSAPDAKECLVHEYLLYRWGIRDDSAVRNIIGQTIRMEVTSARQTPLQLLRLFEADLNNISEEEIQVLEKIWKLLPTALTSLPLSDSEKAILKRTLERKSPGAKTHEAKTIVETFTIVGVIRGHDKDGPVEDDFFDAGLRDADLILPRDTADAFLRQLPKREEEGYSRVRLIVDSEENLDTVVKEVRKLGFNEYSLGLFVQTLRKNVSLIGLTMNFMALVALIVAAVGITNTMFTTVLERTREIGILKAVGAKDRQILCIFLIEGGLIGLLGGLGGVLFGWLASFPGNSYALGIMEKQGHKPLPDTVFLYPSWLLISVPVFAMLMTTLAALLPARRAARVEPVVALRHE